MKQFFIEILVVIGLIAVILSFSNPSAMYSMPKEVGIQLVITFTVLIIFLLGLLYKEKPSDEREEKHIALSGRISYFIGVIILSAGIIVGVLKNEVNEYLVWTLIFMVLTKTISRVYLSIKQ
jgi:tellurite resistance protein TehA-like permease